MRIKTEFGYCDYDFEVDYVHIYNLFVHPEYRGYGRAREILQLAISSIKKTGYKGEISIVAEPKDDGIILDKLICFYKDMGLGVYTYYG